MFDKLKKLLKIVNFSGNIVLKDGTTIMVEGSLEAGSKVYVETPDSEEPIALPDGEYILEDESVMMVEGGEIKSIDEPVVEEVVTDEAIETAEEPVVEETPEAEEPVVEETPEEVAEPGDEMLKKIEDLTKRLDDLEKMILAKEEKFSEIELNFSKIKETLDNTSAVKPLNKVKKVENLTPNELRFNSIMESLKK